MIRYKIIKQVLLIAIFCIGFSSEIFSQSKQPIIDPVSRLSCLVLAQKDSKELWHGTGFFIRVNSKVYFLTNNHIVGGEFHKADFIKRNEELRKDNKPLKIDTLPNNLNVRIYDSRLNSSFFIKLQIVIQRDTNYIKFWANQNKTNLMDVIAIPVSDAVAIQLNNTSIALEKDIKNDLLLAPATDLFIIGFPYSYGAQQIYPLWKRGTIASEPNLKAINQVAFYIDNNKGRYVGIASYF